MNVVVSVFSAYRFATIRETAETSLQSLQDGDIVKKKVKVAHKFSQDASKLGKTPYEKEVNFILRTSRHAS